MFTQLRKKFILVAMCSTFAVLAVIIVTLNLVSYINMVSRADTILEMLSENDGRFPEEQLRPTGELISPKMDGRLQLPPPKEKGRMLSPETPYETRFFSVRLKDTGEVAAVDTGKIAAIEAREAIEYARIISSSGRKKGFYKSYRFIKASDKGDITVIFMDMYRERESFRTLLITGILVSFIGLLAVFILVVIFSKKVFQPVAASYAKQKQFITDASHELKTPLTIISANVEVLEMETGENKWTGSIQKQIGRMNQLVEQMVTLSRMDEKNRLPSPEVFSLSDVIKETAEFYLPLAQMQEKELLLQIEEEQIYRGNESLIRQLASLLLDNALKYSSKKGRVKVWFKQKGKYFEFGVWNTVTEIQKGNLDIIFERFYRLDASRNSETGGFGIGLSIAKSIVEAHNGKITAKSDDGRSIQVLCLLKR